MLVRAREGTGEMVPRMLVCVVVALVFAVFPLSAYAEGGEGSDLKTQDWYGTDYTPGDLDSDNVVNSRDIVHARRYIVGGYAQTVNLAAADVNNDRKVDTTDVILMRRYLAGGYDVRLQSSDLAEQEIYRISYDTTNGDSYLAGKDIPNPNKTSYFEGQSFSLKNLSAPGYRFLGWYDGAGNDANKVTRINATDNEDLELYAHWQMITYTVQYESDLFLSTDSATYTVDKGLVLPTPKLSNYVFVGWSDESGELYGKRIPVGTTGNLTLKANWTSERNKTYTKPNPSDPVVIEDTVAFDDGAHDVLLFTYEIGRIENVPLYTIKDFGYISGDGVTRSATETYSASTSESTAETISNVVAKATTNSSNWTLSSGWNESTSISEEWCKQNGYTKQEAETVAKSDSSNWNVSNSSYGSSSTTNASSSTDGWTNQVKVNGSDSHSSTTGGKISAEINASYHAGVEAGVDGIAKASAGYEIGGKIGGEVSNSVTASKTRGFEAGGSQSHSGTSSSSSSNTSGWNNSASYGGSSTTSRSNTVSTAISEQVSQKTGYGKSYVRSGSESQGLASSNTDSQTDSYGSSTTYNTAASQSVSSSWTTSATKPGYHRWIVAGTAHVFGVVGYDIDTKSFFVYTYSVMDDKTYEFEDYSYTTAAYNDNENGVIDFEVPYNEIMETVSARVFATDGLKVDLATGTIVGYTGTDTCVIIPEYYNAGNGDVVKITGFNKNAFAGKTNIVTVVLSDYITQIPDGAFEGCSSLAFVNGKGVTSIGSRAFAGCTSLQDCGVYSKVTSLGSNAFEGADKLFVNAANKNVALAAINSGAKGLELNLRFLKNDSKVLSGTTFTVPSTMGYFELNGDGRTYSGLAINSNAAETVLNKINVAGTKYLPVKIASSKVTFNQSSISSPGIALALTTNNAEVGLRGTSTVSSTTANAVVCKNVKLYETASDVVGKLVIPQKTLVCGSVAGSQYLQCSNTETINQPTFSALLNVTKVSFDAGGGTCQESNRTLVYGVPVGTLPVPTRDYCTFDGWYLKDTDQKVTESTVLPYGKDLTLVAHWTESWSTDIADGVYSFTLANNQDYVVEVPGSEENMEGSYIRIFHNDNALCQRFRLKKEIDGTYRISNPLSDLILEPGEANSAGNPRICLRKDNGSSIQRWLICKNPDGSYCLRNKGNGLFVGINGGIANETRTQCVTAANAVSLTLNKQRYAIHEWGGYQTFGGLTWDAAKEACIRAGGHLATITSLEEQKTVNQLMTNSWLSRNNLWIGGYQDENTWKWVTGEAFSYVNWASGEPNNSNRIENFLMIYRVESTSGFPGGIGEWNDIKTDGGAGEFYHIVNFGFIIEWEDDAAVTAQSDVAEDEEPIALTTDDADEPDSQPSDSQQPEQHDPESREDVEVLQTQDEDAVPTVQTEGEPPALEVQEDLGIVVEQSDDAIELDAQEE